MSIKAKQPAHISQRTALTLSGFMIVVASLTFTGSPLGDGPDWPVLTTFRDKRSLLNILSHRGQQTPPWLYQGAKGVTAIFWSLLIPMQHSQSIRRSFPRLHRFGGYTVILLSIELGLAGYYMASQGMVTSHENWYHVHSLYGSYIPLPLFVWPSFNAAIAILGIFYFLSLYKLFTTIRARRIDSHRRWAVFHTMTGYAISIERMIALVVLALGWVLHSFPYPIQDWLNLPQNAEAMVEVELSALAWTLSGAGIMVAAWVYFEYARARLIVPKLE